MYVQIWHRHCYRYPHIFPEIPREIRREKKKKSVFGMMIQIIWWYDTNDTKPNYYSDRYHSAKRCSRAALYSTQFHQCSVPLLCILLYTQSFNTGNLDKEDCWSKKEYFQREYFVDLFSHVFLQNSCLYQLVVKYFLEVFFQGFVYCFPLHSHTIKINLHDLNFI